MAETPDSADTGVLNLTGLALEGDKLAQFQQAYSESKLIRGMFNPDGSIKDKRPKQAE
jgi:hypothetical protein|tara:strand:+ start:420 stop:593 length:174 start_codon:yes stop_codon:yes gene_type:complete